MVYGPFRQKGKCMFVYDVYDVHADLSDLLYSENEISTALRL